MSLQENENFNPAMIHGFLSTKVKRKGLRTKIPIESLQVYTSINRPFRVVQFIAKSGKVYSSLIDELLSGYVSEFEECLLLWRPKYIDNQTLDCNENLSSEIGQEQKNKILGVIGTVAKKRKESGEKLLEMDRSIKKIQINRRASASFLIPKFPSSLRHDEMELAKWREESGIFLAASLVTNCPSNEEIEEIVLKDKVYISTHLGIYTNIESGEKRIVALETTRANNMKEAQNNGLALARLLEICEIDPETLVKKK